MICRDGLVWAAGQTAPINSLESSLQMIYVVVHVKGLRGRGLIWTTQIYIIVSQILTKVSYNIFWTIYILADVSLFILFLEIKLFLISLDQLEVIDLLVNSNDIALTLPDYVASVCFTCLTSDTCGELMCVKLWIMCLKRNMLSVISTLIFFDI